MHFLHDPRVGPLKKADLQFRYPLSLADALYGDDLTMRGVPDSVLLNRQEWYEVLYFVNSFAIKHGDARRDVALRAERLIQTSLPGNLRSHAHVSDWLVANWQTAPL